MSFQFPWTNLHELNLDWFLSKFKQFTNNYLGTTATAESVPYNTPPSVTVTGGELDDDTDIVDPFTFNFKIPAGQPGAQGAQGVQGIPGQDGFSPIATVTKTGTVATISITDANGTTTATISDGEVTQAQLDTKAPAIIPTATGSIANFSDGADNLPVSELMVDIVPAQSGSGIPAPDNTRPISGWTGCNVTRTGKNLLPNVSYQNSTTQVFLGQQNGTDYPFDLKAGTYTISAVFEGASKVSYYYKEENESQTIIHLNSVSGEGYSFTLTEGKYRFWMYRSSANGNLSVSEISNFQLELGATDTAYEPYQGTSITVDWTSEAGTVYGGTLDLTTGVLTVTHSIVDLGTLTWSVVQNNLSMYSTGINSIALHNAINPTVWCTNLPQTASASVYSGTEGIALHSNGNIRCVFNGCTLDPATFKSEVSGWLFAFPIDTPQTYQLTPQQVNTLLGVNNIWCNTGDSTVTYTADTMLYIQNLTQPTEDDMTANTTIANGKFFMIGNNLYKASTAIASGSQIIPGTNATPMSLADALNSL